MRRPLVAALASLLVVLAAAVPPAVARVGRDAPSATGAADRGSIVPAPGVVRAIATFPAVPGAADVARLRAAGLRVQPMEHLPLAIVEGTDAQLARVPGLRPDDVLQYAWDTSVSAMGGDAARALGFTGKGAQVAIVDSGIDATHPDLADHVVHNVKLVSGEYANQPGGEYLVVPVDEGPYSNTDVTSGHGTHVAGIIAADGHSDPAQIGVAPDAELIGYAIGEVLFTTAVITAYDHILDHPEWGIDVVNNSWGSSFLLYDPGHPINIATKAVADTGVVVVFAAGNNGSGNTEMTLNPFSLAPWVLSVAASTVDRERSSFSSDGLVVDNSSPVRVRDGRVHFDGDRLGMYHPDLTAPGTDIVSSKASTVDSPLPGGTAMYSGTSMASPHVAGAAAVLRSARPDLTARQVQDVLLATAAPLVDGSPFWESGFGHADLGAAVRFALGADLPARLAAELAADRARFLAAREWQVRASDLWTWDALPATFEGVDTRTIEVVVAGGVDAVKVTLAHPSLATLGTNGFAYDLTVTDADGDVVGTGERSSSAGTAAVLVGVGGDVTPGRWTVTVEGRRGASEPDTIDNESLLGRMTTLQVAQLAARPRATPSPA